MCNLYSLRPSRRNLLVKFDLSDNRVVRWEELPAIFPGHSAPVIRATDDGDRELVMMSWGFVLLQKDKAPRRVMNVR